MRRRTERDLAMLADGALPPRRRDALLRKVTRSARLSSALEAQRFAVAVVRARQDPAPPRLRARVDRLMRDSG